ncbi:type II secretion system F family protein [Agromyces italicus]|uniref:type II secretion system F family protein n=1 Tax=Agromyces italicus TaxID=279572 RepID=UPI0003B6FA9C|nr:type II secretion system F family protein [Agromyces italicus]
MSPILIVGGVAICLLALLVLVFLVIAPPAPRVARDRRLAPGEEHVSALTKITDRATAAIDSATTNRSGGMFSPEALELAGIKTERSGFLILVASATSVMALLGVLLGLANGFWLILAVVFGAATPFLVKFLLSLRTSQRQAKFADQVDDTVQMLAGGLRAGHGLSRTLGAVATEAEEPTSEELARVVNETRLGRNLAEALTNTAQRMKSADFEWVAQAIAINQETGGNLAEVLDQVGRTIRERNQIRRHVKALSAEGRLSAIVLVALPIGVFFFLLVVNPGYVSFFFTNPIGIIALVVAFLLLIIGTVWVSFSVKVKF